MIRVAAQGARVSAQLLELLGARAHGSVSGVFRTGFNISIDEELVYVGNTAHPLSCVGAALPPHEFAALRSRVEVGDRAVCRAGVVRLFDRVGVIELDLTAFEPVDLSLARARRAPIDADARAALTRALRGLDLASAIGIAGDGRLRAHLRALAAPEAGSDVLAAATDFLLGRGLGLTPSGDDVLMGLGVARWLECRERPLLAALGRARLERTTPVSRAYLRALVAGTANEDYIDLASALAIGGTDGFAGPLARIRAVGHTSGSDSLLGFAAGWGIDVDCLLATGGRHGSMADDTARTAAASA